jgi:tripartite-type tricarboxylate transporter receptor subunit TctC
MKSRRSFFRSLPLSGMVALLALGGSATLSIAQTYPDRAIKIIVPTGPGGGYDVYGRLLGDELSRRINQSVVVENKTGAGTVIGTQAAIAAAPDGYTLVVGGLSNIIFNQNLYRKAPYDAMKSLVPVAINYKNTYMVVTAPNSPFKTMKDVIAAAKAKPNGLNLATPGQGTGQQLAAVAFMKSTGIQLQEVPYRGATAVYPDLLSGRVDVFFDSDTGALPFVKSGHARALAITSATRSKEAPDVPTMAEAGIPGLEMTAWIGIFAPAGTPQPIIEQLQKAIAASEKELQPKFSAIGGEYIHVESAKLSSFVSSEYDQWARIIKDSDIKLD